MASALNVTTRTLQNREKNIGTSQMERKTRDLWELLDLLDDYLVAQEKKIAEYSQPGIQELQANRSHRRRKTA